jgi:hypothetical protein
MRLLLVPAILLLSLNLFSNNDKVKLIDDEVDRIYREKLQGSYFKMNTGQDDLPSSEEIMVYRDQSGKIRMIEKRNWGEEFMYTILAYYNKQGELILLLAGNTDNGGEDSHGRYYYEGGKEIFSEKKKMDGYTPDPEFMSAKSFSEKNKKKLAKSVKKEAPEFNNQEKLFRGYIRGINVNVRAQPDVKAKVAGTVDVLDRVLVLNVGKKEKIGSYGEHYWYQVRVSTSSMGDNVEGWVYGAFILPGDENFR